MSHIRLCLVGADGRMGQEIIRAMNADFVLTGAVTHKGSPNEGKTLRDLNLPYPDIRITGPETLRGLLRQSDIYLSFTLPDAEMQNLPVAAEMKKKIVMGTTGLTVQQMSRLRSAVEGNTEAVFASNFSVGINFIAGLLMHAGNLPPGYDASVIEMHHTGKLDSPSGTALFLADIIKSARGYTKEVHGRSGKGKRTADEMEIVSVRAGGLPGTHDIVFAGPSEMIKIEHIAFSRRAFAEGALLAARWIMGRQDKKIHSMKDVLGI